MGGTAWHWNLNQLIGRQSCHSLHWLQALWEDDMGSRFVNMNLLIACSVTRLLPVLTTTLLIGKWVAWGHAWNKRCCTLSGWRSGQPVCFRHILIKQLEGWERATYLESSTQVKLIWGEKSNSYSRCAKGVGLCPFLLGFVKVTSFVVPPYPYFSLEGNSWSWHDFMPANVCWPVSTRDSSIPCLKIQTLRQRLGKTRFPYTHSAYCQLCTNPKLRCGNERLSVFFIDVRTSLNQVFVFISLELLCKNWLTVILVGSITLSFEIIFHNVASVFKN